MRLRNKIAALGAAVLLAITGATAASATDAGDSTNTKTVTVNGHELGPKDGLVVTNEAYAVVPGGGRVGASYGPAAGEMSPMTAWGTSFAYSVEQLQLQYMGYGYAAANVYSGKRIVEVCFWYTRGGVKLTPTTCSDANFNGGWNPGAEVHYGVTDSLDPNAPQTIFNISTVRIDPTAHW